MAGPAGPARLARPDRWAAALRPIVDGRRCARSAFPRAACDRCAHVCPPQAVSFDRGPVVGDRCDGCGACIAVCPSDVFASAAGSESALGEAIARAARDGFARVTCARVPGMDGSFTLPCLGRLTPAALVGAAVAGAGDIDLHSPDCTACDRWAALQFESECLALARSLAALAGCDLSLTRSRGRRRPAAPEVPDRRAFFRSLASGPRFAAAALATPAEVPQPRSDDRRARLLALVRGEPSRREDQGSSPRSMRRSPGRPARAGPGSQEYWPFGRVEIDVETCLGCPVCATVCPTGAIGRREAEGGIALTVATDRCTACWACADACLVGAIRVRAATAQDLLAGRGEREVVIRGGTCPVCRRFSSRPAGEPCAFCQRTRSRVAVDRPGRPVVGRTSG